MRRFYERFGFSEVEPEAALLAEASADEAEAPREPVEVG
jgi:hypothetical protein